MSPSGPDMKFVKFQDCCSRTIHLSNQSTFFSLANRPPDRTGEARSHLREATAQIKFVSVEGTGRLVSISVGLAAPDLKVFPVSLSRQLGKFLHLNSGLIFIEYERVAKVAERKANSPPARKGATHLHEWQQRRSLAAPKEMEVEGFMTVTLDENGCQGCAVKGGRLWVGMCKAIPSSILERTTNITSNPEESRSWITPGTRVSIVWEIRGSDVMG